MNEYKLIHLPKEQWKGTPIMMVTELWVSDLLHLQILTSRRFFQFQALQKCRVFCFYEINLKKG